MSFMDHTIRDLGARLAGAKTAANELRQFDEALRAEHAALLKEREHVIFGPQPRDAVLANMERVVDALAAAWAKNNALSFVSGLGPGLEEREDGTLAERRPRLPMGFYGAGGHSAGVLDLYRAASVFPELAKCRFAELIRAADYQEGLPLSERPRRVGELDARLREIEERHSQLVDEAATWNPPMVLELMPRVKERRAAAAELAQRNAHANADRRAREAGVNQRHERRASFTLSPYLQKRDP